MAIASLLISALALAVSVVTAWLTMLRRGHLGMTRPSLIGFLYDLPGGGQKIFFRSMLYATGKRGHIIEAMYLVVQRGESRQSFNFWMYGETASLRIGSGLRIGEDGVSSNHHFMLAKDQELRFGFDAGAYVVDVYAAVLNRKASLHLTTLHLILSEEQALGLSAKRNGVLFTWDIESRRYKGHALDAPAWEQVVVSGMPMS
jgi:hypothetical protein